MPTRRTLLASAALVPLLTAGLQAARAQVETPAAEPAGSPVATPQTVPDLTGVTPLPLTGERLATFEAYIGTMLAERGVPGAAVAVVQDGAVVFAQGFGVRELGRPEPVTADTLLRIGSVTKSLSSLLTATLVDAGRLTWETPVRDLLPDFAVADPALTASLTMRDAFCACTGLPRRDMEFQFRAHDLTPELLIAGMADLPLTAPYGAMFQYNNQMVAAGGFAAAVADGGSPDDLSHSYDITLRENVLNPIGMPRTTDVLATVVAGNDYAVPHAPDVTGALHPLPLLEDDLWIVPVAPSGALWSSAREMARYVQTELGQGISPDGVRVVSAENLERAWQPGVALPAAPGTPPTIAAYAGHYGLGWFIGDYGGQRVIQHGGNTLGFTAHVTFLPEAGLGLVILTNAANVITDGVTFRLLELLFDQPATFDDQLAPLLAAAAAGRAEFLAHLGEVDPAAVTPYLGWYANPDLGAVHLALRDGALLFEAAAFHSTLRPLLAEDGAVAGYVLVDPPYGSVPPQMTLTLAPDAAGQPGFDLTVPGDPGLADVVYEFDPVDPTATPTP